MLVFITFVIFLLIFADISIFKTNRLECFNKGGVSWCLRCANKQYRACASVETPVDVGLLVLYTTDLQVFVKMCHYS